MTFSSLGFGVQPPDPSLGNMLVSVQPDMVGAPWTALVPIVAVIALLFALYAVGEALRAMSAGSPSRDPQKTLVPLAG